MLNTVKYEGQIYFSLHVCYIDCFIKTVSGGFNNRPHNIQVFNINHELFISKPWLWMANVTVKEPLV